MTTLEALLEELPEELLPEVEAFVTSLLEKHGHKAAAKPKQEYLRLTWRGALRDMRDEYTSVELQHKILDWCLFKHLNITANSNPRMNRPRLSLC